MTQIIGGHYLGLFDGSFTVLNRNDQTGQGTIGHGVQSYANISNGNLILQERDIFLPSFGEDFNFVRTYNSRGEPHDYRQWTFSPSVILAKHSDQLAAGGNVTDYTVTYGDGSSLEFVFNSARNLWISTDGEGAYETLQVLAKNPPTQPDVQYVVTRGDRSKYLFDKDFNLISVTDSNGVATTLEYSSGRISKIRDDTGHVLSFTYNGPRLLSISDETNAVLVQYAYDQQDLLSQVTDRYGHVTKYHYNLNKLIDSITLPDSQKVGNTTQTYATRTLTFTYTSVKWDDQPHTHTDFDGGDKYVISQITDSNGGITTFEYNFQFGTTSAPEDRDLAFKPNGNREFLGGTTRVVDALGNARAYSNAAEYVAWRTAHGFYAQYTNYNPQTQAAQLAAQNAQAEQIRAPQSVTYTYDANGQITKVKDELGFETTYTYDFAGNLTSITDANGYGALNNDSAYYQKLRQDLGFAALVAGLSGANKDALKAMFTTTFTYDSNGNLLQVKDNAGNITKYTYTSFNQVETITTALGHVTTFTYDAKQNLIKRVDGLGNIVAFEYDANGNLSKKIVYLDKNDLVTASKQQVTLFGYDAFGNNVQITDAEGKVTTKAYDHFGNVILSKDARGNQTTFTYDADDRLLAMTDPEGHTTVYAYDAVGNKIAITDANGHTITQVFDKNNMLITTIDPSANAALTRTTQYLYDILGNYTQTTDAEGRKLTYTYDAHRQVIDVQTDQVKNASDQLVTYHETYAYDGESNTVTKTDRNNNVTQYLYTVTGLVRRSTDAIGNVIEYLYDADLRQIQVTVGAQLAPALRRVLKFGYDAEDQLTSQTDALDKVTQYSYDAAGNVVAITDANDHTTNFEFDRNNRLLKEIRPGVIDPVTNVLTRYTVIHAYDAGGNEVSVTDENGHTMTMAYDKANRLILLTDNNGIKTAYGYDSLDNRTLIAIGVTASVDASSHVVITNMSKAQVTTFAYDEFNQLVAKTDGVGNALVSSDEDVCKTMRTGMGYAALVANLSTSDKNAILEKFTEHYTFDRVGNRTSIVDHLDRTRSMAYDALNRLVSMTEATGVAGLARTTTYRYDGNDNLVKTVAPENRTTTALYDAMNRRTDEVDAMGVVTHYEYDNVGNIVKRTLAFGTTDARVYQYVYDLNDRMTLRSDPLNHSQAYEYDAVGNRTKVTDARNFVTQYFYDALDRNIKIIDPRSFQTKYEYDGVGNRITLIDARGGITRLTYDAGDRKILITDAEGRKTSLEYDLIGNVVTQKTAFGTADEQKTTYVYDAEGNLRQTIDANNKPSSSNFDALYNETETTDANGHVTKYAYDALNRLLTVTDPLLNVTTYTYDAADNVLTETRPGGRTRTFTYDANDRVMTEKDPLDNVTTYLYDRVGNQVKITRPGGRVTTFEYDLDDRLTKETDPLLHSKQYQYDANDNVVKTIDALNRATVYAYDEDDQLVQITDPGNNVTKFVYDGNGNRVQVIDARLNRTTTYFNANDEAVLSVDGTGFASKDVYDANGNIVQHIDYLTRVAVPLDPAVMPTLPAQFRTTTYVYDKLNRAVQVTNPLGGNSFSTYDDAGNKLTETDENGHKVTYAYDADDRLTAQLSAEGYLTLFEYDVAGNQTARKQYRNIYSLVSGQIPPPASGDNMPRITSATYDKNDRVTTRTDANNTVTTYEYDVVGNETAQVVGTGDAQRRTETHYDLADRIIETVDAALTVTHFDLDEVGNVTKRYDAYGLPAVQRITSYTYDALDRLETMTDALLHVTKYEYDATGNLKKRTSAFGLPEQRVEQFEYDAVDRMTAQINGENERTEFTYDAVGNRTRITVAPGATEQRVNSFEYDKDDRLVAEIDGKGIRTEYVYDAVGNTVEVIQAKGVSGQERHTLMTYSADDRLLSVASPVGYSRAYSDGAEFQAWRTANGYAASAAALTPANIDAILGTERTKYEYDDLGNKTKITDADGTVTQNMFDILGRLTQNIVGVGGPKGGIKTVNDYDLFGNVLKSTKSFADDTDARSMTYTYDKLDQQKTVTDGEGFVTSFDYDVFGNVTHVKRGDYLGANAIKLASKHPLDSYFTYDAMDRLLSTKDGRNNVNENSYDALGNRLTQKSGIAGMDDAHVSTLTFAYDDAGRVIQRTTGTGGVVKLTYDKAGNQTKREILQSGPADNTGVWTVEAYEYDGNSRVVAKLDSYNVRTEYTYDAVGNQTAITFAKGTTDERSIGFEYDLDDNKTASIDGLGKRTTMVYDAVGNLVKQTDALGRVQRFYYDAFHRVIAQLDPRNYLTEMTRDSAGNITQTTLYMTAVAGIVTDSSPKPTGTSSASDRIVKSEFDLSNRLKTLTSPDGSYKTYDYDSTDKVLKQTQYGAPSLMSITALQTPRVMTWAYDDSGRMITFTNVDNVTETYTYDAANNKTSETIHNPNPLIAPLASGGRTDPDRKTTFEYDLDNRLTKQIFDAAGLNLQQTLAYDKAGNVIQKTDGNSHTTTSQYDKENRLTQVTNPLSQTIKYEYDRVGNLTKATNANNYTVTTKYDLNNRAIEESRNSVEVRHWVGGVLVTETATPTTKKKYDDVGNVVQITDAAGYITTRWYDAGNNVIGERNGDGALRRFTYDGLSQLITVTQDMAFQLGVPDLTTPPTPSGDVRTVTNAYDLGGHVVKTTYSSIAVTTLANTSGSSPTSSAATVTPEERNYYDAFGNLIESVDRNGNHSYAYFDLRGRQVATVDAGGYVVETDYDDQDHVVQQRKYKTKLTGPVSSALKPTAPDNTPVKVDRIYDTAGRLIEEWSPAVHTASGEVRSVTRYTYDKASNVTSKTLGYATILGGVTSAGANARTEFYFYDEANRRRAVVGADRVLNTFSYDGVGNLTAQKRFYNTIASNFDLSAATLTTVLGAVTADANKDEETTFQYDAANKVVRRTDTMGPGTTDDLVNISGYDEVGNTTYRKDPDNFVTQTRYDSAGHAVEVVAPNGSHTIIQYDTGGLKVQAYTGGATGSSAPAAVIVGASAANGANAPLVISWNQSGSNVTSWVAWDTVAHAGTNPPSSAPGVAGVYGHATSGQGTGNGLSASIAVATSGTIYFRIVSRDAGGNLTWTEEKSVFVPPRVQSMAVAPSGTNFTLTVTFDTAVTSAALELASNASPPSYSVAASNGNKTFTFTFAGTKTDQYHVKWVYNGTTYTTSNVAFLAAAGAHVDAGNGSVSWPLPTDGTNAVGNGQFMLVNGVLLSDTEYMGSVNGVAVTADTSTRVNNTQLNFFPGVAPNTTVGYDALYGNLSTSAHKASISWSQRQFATAENASYDSGADKTTWDIVWHNEAVPVKTNVSASFLLAEKNRISGAVHFSYRNATTGTTFTSDATDSTFTQNGSDYVYSSQLDLTAGSQYDIKIWYTDVDGKEVIVEWRRVTVPAAAAVPATTQVQTSGHSSPTLPADINLTRGTTQDYTGDRSIQVLASETGGQIARGGTAALTVTVGSYVGPVSPGTSSLTLTLADTANNTGGMLQTNGATAKTYYTTIEYNALGIKIASNEENGLWKRFGVDANGNAVKTDLFGTPEAEQVVLTPITTYKQYDARNLEIASWGASVAAGRAVTRTTYDYASRKLTVQDPGNTAAQAREFAYDEVGNLVSSIDALDKTTSMVYNIFGQLVATTDANNHVRRKAYNSVGWLTEESIDGVTDKKTYTYDNFGRRTQVARGISGNSTNTTYAYDQRDRVTTVTDGLSNVTRYYYDGRDNRIWTQDANGHWFGQVFDGAGQLTHKYSFVTRWTTSDGVNHTGTAPTTLADALAGVNGTNTTYAASLVDEVTAYDLFSNKLSETDGAGHHTFYTYGAFGQLSSVSGDSTSAIGADSAGAALVTTYTYDRFGNRTGETSNYGKAITFTYDDAGKMTVINDTATKTKTTYTYDVAGRRSTELLQKGDSLTTWHNYTYGYNANSWLSWSDNSTSASGIGETFTYDNVGNVTNVTGKTSTNNSYVSHSYTFDNANRVLTAAGNTYTYDSRGRRSTWNNGTTTVTYTYDNADRVTQAAGSDAKTLKWTYDNVGNVTSVQDSNLTFTKDSAGNITGVSGTLTKDVHYTFYQYDTNNLSYFSQSSSGSDDHGDAYTGNTTYADKSGQTISVALTDGSDPGDVKTFTYSYVYNADGTEHSVTASGTGDVAGSSVSTYNANRQLSHIDLGKGDDEDQERNETKDFEYDNAGHIVQRTHDTGTEAATTTSYLYALDQPAGEYTDKASPTLDTGNYSVIQNVPNTYGDSGPDFPGSSVSEHIVAVGETLQSIASAIYGHPELWFVIADANGLTGSEPLSAGMRLLIPNSVQYGGFDVNTHTIYKEGDIVGSKLPNLKSPPAKDNTCAIIAAIILIVIVAIVAVVVTVLTVGAAAPAAAAALGFTAGSVAGILIGVAVGAVIGAAVAFTASVITQGILVGFGLQEEFDWKQVAADTVAGAISGAAGGLGAMIEAAQAASVAIKVVNVVGQATLEAIGETLRQLIVNDGHFDQINWIMVGVAGAGGAFGALASSGIRATKQGEKVAADTLELAELDKLASKSKLLKAEDLEIGDTVFKTSKFKFKVVEDPSTGSLIVKRFERLSALRNGTQLIEATDASVSRWTRFKSVFKQGLLDQTEGVRTLFRGIGNKLENAVKGGTVAGSKVGNVKQVRSFEKVVDPVTGIVSTVAKDAPVFRKSYLGTLIAEKFSQFRETWSSIKVSDRIKTVKTVEETTLASGETMRTIKSTNVVRTSWAKKLAETLTIKKFGNTKIVKGVTEVQLPDGSYQLVKQFRQVYRERFLKTSLTDRIAETFSRAPGTIKKYADKKVVRVFADKTLDNGQIQRVLQYKYVDRLDVTGQSRRAIIAAALSSAKLALLGKLIKHNPLTDFLKEAWNDEPEKFFIGTVGGLLATGAGVAYKQFALTPEERDKLALSASPYRSTVGGSSFFREGFGLWSKKGALIGGIVQLAVTTGYTSASRVLRLTQPNPPVNTEGFAIYGHPERSVGKDSFMDRASATTFSETHELMYGWVPNNWINTAGQTASQILSPLGIDQAVDLYTALSSNRLIAGEMAKFNAQSAVGIAAMIAGRVGVNPVPTPIQILNNFAPDPRG